MFSLNKVNNTRLFSCRSAHEYYSEEKNSLQPCNLIKKTCSDPPNSSNAPATLEKSKEKGGQNGKLSPQHIIAKHK